mmetsp:Transcript_17687/g.45719  ORF Transcript_17687/g.45719 Transcript_17687/m.45719 type:complete len:253 (-) Transcript_17687:762-1520(-)
MIVIYPGDHSALSSPWSAAAYDSAPLPRSGVALDRSSPPALHQRSSPLMSMPPSAGAATTERPGCFISPAPGATPRHAKRFGSASRSRSSAAMPSSSRALHVSRTARTAPASDASSPVVSIGGRNLKYSRCPSCAGAGLITGSVSSAREPLASPSAASHRPIGTSASTSSWSSSPTAATGTMVYWCCIAMRAKPVRSFHLSAYFWSCFDFMISLPPPGNTSIGCPERITAAQFSRVPSMAPALARSCAQPGM